MQLSSAVSAVITGGASGLGAATARALAAQGVMVAIFDMQVEKGEAVAQECNGVFCAVNITDDESVIAGFAKARSINGQERILVNCAGKGSTKKTVNRSRDDGSIQYHATELFNAIIQVNLVATYRCLTLSAAGMLTLDPIGNDGERGAIVNTASIAAEDGQMGQAAYAASKAGVVGLTLPVARDLMREGIRVNTILPGVFETPMMQGATDKIRQSLADSIPFPKRFGKPEEYARLALAIIENCYINGEDVRLDGALRMGAR